MTESKTFWRIKDIMERRQPCQMPVESPDISMRLPIFLNVCKLKSVNSMRMPCIYLLFIYLFIYLSK